MKKPIAFLLLALLVGGAFLAGFWTSQRRVVPSQGGAQGPRVLYYVDPMNPAHTSDQPGRAPCGMPMEPVYADEGEGPAGSAVRFLPAGSVRITPERQQLIGVRVEKAERTLQGHSVRTLGRVAPEENRTYAVNAGDDGWVWKVVGGTTGSVVQKDQLLATIYNYAFLSRQQQYLYALDFEQRRQRPWGQPAVPQSAGEPQGPAQSTSGAHGSPGHGPAPPMGPASMIPTAPGSDMMSGSSVVYSVRDQLSVARLELFNLGVSEHQLQEIGRARQITLELEVRSPATGIVVARSITPQSKFTRGTELFRIADLSRVWILTDVFEREAPHVKPGVPVRVSLPHQGKVFRATVSDVPPVFDPVSRSYKVRLEAENPDLELRPDMVVDVEFLLHLPEALTVPADAVLDTGRARTVFVSVGDGYFEPRMVETGRRFAGRVEILSGVMPGEAIVVSGNFLVDSESKMRMAASGMLGPQEKDPVCGMPVSPAQARRTGHVSEREGQVHFFCSEPCRLEFDKRPVHHVSEGVVAMPAPGQGSHAAGLEHAHGGHGAVPAHGTGVAR